MNAFSDGFTPLFGALYRSRIETVHLLISHGADVTIRWAFGKTPIAVAAEHGLQNLVELFIENGADAASIDEAHLTPLHYAVSKRHGEVARTLISHGADVNATDEFYRKSPLHLAAEDGFYDLGVLLVAHGANINAKAKGNSTPLHMAAERGQEAFVKLLIDKGAHTNAEDAYYKTPLYKALKKFRWNTCSLLIPTSMIISGFNYDPAVQKTIITLLCSFKKLGISKDLHLLILSKDQTIVETMFFAMLPRIKNGIERNCLVEYVQTTPAFLKPIILQHIYLNTIKELTNLMDTVLVENQNSLNQEEIDFLSRDTLEEKFGEDIQENIRTKFGF